MDYVILDFCQGRVAQWLGLWTVEVLGAAVVEGVGSSPARSIAKKLQIGIGVQMRKYVINEQSKEMMTSLHCRVIHAMT